MDMSNKTLILVFLIIYINCLSGLAVPRSGGVVVDILDGEVKVSWNHPAGAPPDCYYNVVMANHSGDYTEVESCTGITRTSCDLTSLIHDYGTGYRVKVQLVTGNNRSEMFFKRFNPRESNLRPPSFTLWPTSSTLTVYIDPKPFLGKLFPFGPKYTIYLMEKGQDKNTTAYLDDDAGDDQRAKTFKSLYSGREYCVNVKVAGSGSLSISSVSPELCVRLPEREWFIVAVTSLSILGVLALVVIMASILLCYVRRPEKIPTTLKSPITGWVPLSVGEGTMEVVTDKGWFLSSNKTEVKNCAKVPVTHALTEDHGEEDRRTSMDSGVSMESNSTGNSGGSPPKRQEDSGCGSLGVPESSSSGQTDYPLQKERTDTDITRKREDSGVGWLGCQRHSSSMALHGQDSGSLNEAVSGGSYRRQSPSSVQIPVCNEKEEFKQILPESVLAEVFTGYRAGPQTCICSGAGQCTWCHKQGLFGTGVFKQYRSMCIDDGLLSGKCDFVDSYKAGLSFPGYSKKTQMDTVMVDDLDTTFIPLGETFPLLTTLTPLPHVDGGQDFNMNNVSLSLCDIQLTSD